VSPVAGGTLFRGVDRATLAAAFAGRLRRAGVRTNLTTTQRFAAALEVADVGTRDELYWVARTCLVDDVAQLDTFDRVFAAVFDPAATLIDRTASRDPSPPTPPVTAGDDDRMVRTRDTAAREAGGGGVPWLTPPDAAIEDDEGEAALELTVPRPSPLADRVDVPFAALDEDELALVGSWIEAATVRWPSRPTRRRRPSARGPIIDRRRTLRRGMRTAGEPLRLVRSRIVRRPRRVVLLVDVSGSMRPYVRAYLHLVRGLSRATDAETFAFATRLTRLTPTLAHRDVGAAIERASAAVDDRFTGTRIAGSLDQLLRDPVWNTTVRGAVIVIVSDGWDSDPPEHLEATMQRLARMAHRIVWVNPRVAAPEFTPTTRGMRTAVPHCDELCSGHSLSALEEVLAAIGRA
jgi:uncharacterized protein